MWGVEHGPGRIRVGRASGRSVVWMWKSRVNLRRSVVWGVEHGLVSTLGEVSVTMLVSGVGDPLPCLGWKGSDC